MNATLAQFTRAHTGPRWGVALFPSLSATLTAMLRNAALIVSLGNNATPHLGPVWARVNWARVAFMAMNNLLE